MSIGENIKRLRLECELTQGELAQKVGVTQSMIAQIERGTKVPTMPLGREIADAVGHSVEELYAEGGD